MTRTAWAVGLTLCLLAAPGAFAQDTTGTIEGAVTDKTAGVVAGAHVVARNVDTGFTKETSAGADGFYRLLLLPIGQYSVTVTAPQFATLVRDSIQVNVSQTVRLNVQLELPSVTETVTVTGGAQLVDTSTNALGRVVTGRELVDLPLNGRNFTQLGLLQTGVAPLTAGVVTAGGSLRQGQAYAVNGMRPEQNMYLVDGAQNINRMDGGYALKLPVEAIAEFRILTQSAPPEYGGTGGATTSVVTRSGGNQFHGSLYEFLRNDAFDARNFFSEKVEPLEAAPVRRHDRRADRQGPAAVLRLLRRLPQPAGHDHDRHRADRGGASGRLLGDGDAAAQPGGRRHAVSRQPDSCRRDQPGRAQRPGSLSARQRLAVHLPGDAGRHQRARFRPAAASTSTPRRTTRSSGATRTPAATTSTRSRCAAPTCRAFRRATTSRRTRRRCRAPTSSRRR